MRNNKQINALLLVSAVTASSIMVSPIANATENHKENRSITGTNKDASNEISNYSGHSYLDTINNKVANNTKHIERFRFLPNTKSSSINLQNYGVNSLSTLNTSILSESSLNIVSFIAGVVNKVNDRITDSNTEIVDSIRYLIEEGGAIAVKGSEKSALDNGIITIPDSIVVDGEKVPVVGIGENAFNNFGGDKLIRKVVIGNNVEFIGDDAFRDNNISTIEYGNSVDSIGARAFANNKLSGKIVIPDTIVGIDSEAYRGNKIESVDLSDNISSFGENVFANNADTYVKVFTESNVVNNANYSQEFGGNGHVVNPARVLVRSIDSTGKKIIPDYVVGDGKNGQLFSINKESSFSPKHISGYKIDSEVPIKYTPASDREWNDNTNTGNLIKVKYIKVDENPYFEIDNLSFKQGDEINEEVLRSRVKAFDTNGNELPSSSIKVDVSQIDSSRTGTQNVTFTVTDSEGRTKIENAQIIVGDNWPEYEFADGWQIKDFLYDGNKVVGFSDSGMEKLNFKESPYYGKIYNNNVLYIPPVNEKGEKVTEIGSNYSISGNNSLTDKGITEIGGNTWQNITVIGDYSLSNNDIEKIPNDSFENIVYIGNNAFSKSKIKEVKDWGEVKYIGVEAFYKNDIQNVESFKNVEYIGTSAFYENKNLSYIKDWGKVNSIGSNSFYNTGLESLPESWGDISVISDQAFANTKIKSINSWDGIKDIKEEAFSNSEIETLPTSWSTVETLGRSAFYGNNIREINTPDWGKIREIGSSAFKKQGAEYTGQEDYYTGNHIYWAGILEKLPDSWGNVEIIGASAFEGNNISTLPDSWGKVREIRGNLTVYEPPEPNAENDTTYGQVHLNGAFENNPLQSLPKSWGEVELIGAGAFTQTNENYNNEFDGILPKTWDNVEKIEAGAFKRLGIEELPPSWGNVREIGGTTVKEKYINENGDVVYDYLYESVNFYGAFEQNNIRSFPDSWGNVEFLGDASFFLASPDRYSIETFPSNWGKIERIPHFAFYGVSLSEIELESWGNIKEIGDSAFSASHLSNIPNNWGEVEKIGELAFSVGGLESLPDSWGKITEIPDRAFHGNRLTSLPEWDGIEKIEEYAFASNDYKEIPSDLKNINYIEPNAFSFYGGTTSTREFRISDDGLTESVVNGLGETNLDYPIFIYTYNVTNPNNVASTENVKINPIELTIKYVDTNGNPLKDKQGNIIAPDKTTHVYDGINTTFTPQNIYGYDLIESSKTPINLEPSMLLTEQEKEAANNGDRKIERTIQYRKVSDAELSSRADDTNMSLKTAKSGHTIGDNMVANVKIDRTGFAKKTLTNPTIRIYADTEYVDLNTLKVPNTSGNTVSLKLYDYDGVSNYREFTYKGDIGSGDNVDLPFTVAFKKNVTPYDKPINVQAELVDSSTNTPIALSNEDYFKATDKKPYMRTHISNANDKKYIEGYDRTDIDPTRFDYATSGGYVADNGKNFMEYTFEHEDLVRNIDEYDTVVTLPTYEVNQESETYKKTGAQNTAVFKAEENPGWRLSEDRKSVIYTGINETGKLSIATPTLKLRYPGAVEGRMIEVRAQTIMYPEGRERASVEGFNEELLITNSTQTAAFFRMKIPTGHIYYKRPLLPQKQGIYFYDSSYYRNQDFNWALDYNAYNTDLHNLVFEDHDLDSRMYYDSLEIPANLGEVVVTLVDEEGATIDTYQVASSTSNRKVILDKDKALQAKSLRVSVKEALRSGNSGSIIVTTKLREPEKDVFESVTGTQSNFNNTLTFRSDEVTGSITTSKLAYPGNQSMKAIKTSTYQGDVLSGQGGIYHIGFHPQEGYGEDITNFQQIDLLPKNIELKGYKLTDKFAQIEGSKIEKIDNYKNTGRTAIIVTAPKVPNSIVTPGEDFLVAEINTEIGFLGRNGNYVNDTFVKADGTKLENPVDNTKTVERIINNTDGTVEQYRLDFLPTGNWSRAESSTNVGVLEVMMQKKSIRTYDENGNPSEWSDTAVTYPGQKFDYKLELINATNIDRTNPVIYDMFPDEGDYELAIQETPRGSQFANKFGFDWKAQRLPIIPEGMEIDYNLDTTWNNLKQSGFSVTDTSPLENLKWENAVFDGLRGIRIKPKEGQTVILPKKSKMEFIIPMTAPTDGTIANNIPAFRDSYSGLNGRTAYNSFYYKDDQQPRLIEGNVVSNTMRSKKIDIEFDKNGNSLLTDDIKPLSGAKFEYRRNDKTLVQTAYSNENGKVYFANIEPKIGDYIVEVSAPNGYEISSQKIEINQEWLEKAYNPTTKNVSPATGNIVVDAGEVFNEKKISRTSPTGNVEFVKVDANGNPLSNATFTLSKEYEDENGTTQTLTYEATSNSNGEVKFKNVRTAEIADGQTPNSLNSYTLTEIKAPRLLQPIEPITGITVTERQTTKVGKNLTFGNKNVSNAIVNDKAQLTISKIGVLKSSVTNSDGSAKNLKDYSGLDGGAINGATLQIVDDSTGEIVSTITPNTTKGAIVPNLELDKIYRVEETVVPNGYKKVDNLDTRFKINTQGNLLDANNQPFEKVINRMFYPNVRLEQKAGVNIRKVSENGAPIAGVEFTLQNRYGYSEAKVTDEDGYANWDNLENGSYSLIETKAPNGVIADTREINVYVDNANKSYNYTIENISTDILIKKIYKQIGQGKYGEDTVANWPLQGAVFELRESENGSVLQSNITTDLNGYAKISYPMDSTKDYYLVETKAPNGYAPLNNPIVINASNLLAERCELERNYTVGDKADYHTLSYDDACKDNMTVEIENKPLKGRLIVSKVDESNNPILNKGQAVFEVQRLVESETGDIEYNGKKYTANNVIYSSQEIKTGNANALAVIENMDIGVYQIVEKQAPDGYIVNPEPTVFEFSYDGQVVYSHVFENKGYKPEIDITKTIDGFDSNSKIDAVLLNNQRDTMEVEYVVENNGNTTLNDVEITDEIVNGNSDTEYINNLIKDVEAEIYNDMTEYNANNVIKKETNGSITLTPGQVAVIKVTVDAPEMGTLHTNTGSVTATSAYGSVEDTDDANAVRIDTKAKLPNTGGQGMAIIVLLGLLIATLALVFTTRRKNA